MSNENDLSKVKEKINKIEKKSGDGGYIYRGERKTYKGNPYFGKVSSSLWREYRIEADYFDIEVAQTEMLDAAKKHTGDPPRQFLADLAASLNVTGEYIGETTDFEILTEIQHYGGKTNLIDFTTDYLIALFFACDGSHDKDGRIILLQRTEEKSKKYQIVEPKNPRNRVISQKSVFVRPPKGYVETDDYEVINIPKSLKEPMLTHLSKYHSISKETIYNDLHGFIRNQDIHASANKQFYRGFACQNRGDEATTTKVKQQEYEKAIQYYTESIKYKRDFTAAYNNRGSAYHRIGDYNRAIEDYDKAIEIQPDDAELYYNRGTVYGRKGELDNAITDFDKAIELKPDYDNAYHNRGNAYYKKGEYDNAITDFDKAIELKPDYDNAYYNRGNAYYKKGELDNAITDFDKAIELKPDYDNAYYNRGNAYYKKGEYDNAITDFDKAIELKPDYVNAYSNRGTVYGIKGELDNAITDFDKAIELKPDYVDAYYNRGTVYSSKGELDNAITDFDKAIELKPDYVDAYYNRGNAYYKKGEYDNAITDFDKAIELKPDYVDAYHNRGVYDIKGE